MMRVSIKALSGIIALLGLWEFGDIAALFVPGFGRIPFFVWDHIVVGFILMIVGVWAVRANKARLARVMHWIAAVSGVWLMIGSYISRPVSMDVGLWNDLIVGGLVAILGIWAALIPPR